MLPLVRTQTKRINSFTSPLQLGQAQQGGGLEKYQVYQEVSIWRTHDTQVPNVTSKWKQKFNHSRKKYEILVIT